MALATYVLFLQTGDFVFCPYREGSSVKFKDDYFHSQTYLPVSIHWQDFLPNGPRDPKQEKN